MDTNRIVYGTSTESAARKAEREKRAAEQAAQRSRNLDRIHHIVNAPFDEDRTPVSAFLPTFAGDLR